MLTGKLAMFVFGTLFGSAPLFMPAPWSRRATVSCGSPVWRVKIAMTASCR